MNTDMKGRTEGTDPVVGSRVKRANENVLKRLPILRTYT